MGIHIVHILLNNSSNPDMLTAARYPSLASATSSNSTVLTPIVCICYTNHVSTSCFHPLFFIFLFNPQALDQFLEGVIASGLPPEQVVRVGGRSKSPVLQQRNLQDLAYLHISPSESYRYTIPSSLLPFTSQSPASPLTSPILIRRGTLKGEAESLENAIRDYTVMKQKKKLSFHDIKEFLKFHYEHHYQDISERAAKNSIKYKARGQYFLADTESAVFDISFL